MLHPCPGLPDRHLERGQPRPESAGLVTDIRPKRIGGLVERPNMPPKPNQHDNKHQQPHDEHNQGRQVRHHSFYRSGRVEKVRRPAIHLTQITHQLVGGSRGAGAAEVEARSAAVAGAHAPLHPRPGRRRPPGRDRTRGSVPAATGADVTMCLALHFYALSGRSGSTSGSRRTTTGMPSTGVSGSSRSRASSRSGRQTNTAARTASAAPATSNQKPAPTSSVKLRLDSSSGPSASGYHSSCMPTFQTVATRKTAAITAVPRCTRRSRERAGVAAASIPSMAVASRTTTAAISGTPLSGGPTASGSATPLLVCSRSQLVTTTFSRRRSLTCSISTAYNAWNEPIVVNAAAPRHSSAPTLPARFHRVRGTGSGCGDGCETGDGCGSGSGTALSDSRSPDITVPPAYPAARTH